jgi:hypothetical protein
MTKRSLVILVALVGLALAGCGDDGDGDNVDAYCDFSAELDEQDGAPSDEQLDQVADLAPDEISDQIDVVVEILKEEGPEGFGDPEVMAAFEEIEDFEAENC